MRRTLFLAVALSAFSVPTQTLFAQYSENGIHGTGSVVLERPAEKMRMQISLLSKSTKDLPDALYKLKARRAKVEKQLETLGAVKQSAKFGDPRLDESQDENQQRQMAMMMRQRMNQRNKKQPEKEAAKPVKVAMKLTAEWALKSTEPTAMLLETSKLQDAIKAADLSGMKEVEEASAEEEEESEEMDEQMQMFGNSRNGPKPGEPEFMYIAAIPDADRKKALGEAFAKAKSEADELAKAANLQLDALISLSSTGAVDNVSDDSYRQVMYNSEFSRYYQRQMNQGDSPSEAFGPAPGILKYRVGVSATYSLKSAK